jgi:hypothetical protein
MKRGMTNDMATAIIGQNINIRLYRIEKLDHLLMVTIQAITKSQNEMVKPRLKQQLNVMVKIIVISILRISYCNN